MTQKKNTPKKQAEDKQRSFIHRFLLFWLKFLALFIVAMIVLLFIIGRPNYRDLEHEYKTLVPASWVEVEKSDTRGLWGVTCLGTGLTEDCPLIHRELESKNSFNIPKLLTDSGYSFEQECDVQGICYNVFKGKKGKVAIEISYKEQTDGSIRYEVILDRVLSQ